MYNFPIGVLIDSFKTDLPTALKKAADIGAKGIQVYSTHGDMSPEALTPEKRREYMDIVNSSSDALQQIINDILDLSCIETGVSEFKRENKDIVGMVLEVAELYLPAMKPSVQLVVDVPEGELRASTDAGRVKQVLFNLLNNAVKFTEKGTIVLKVEKSDEFLTFSVADTGSGIPEDKLEVIFSQFDKANKTVLSTGLGLAISRSIVERLGGTVGVTSKIGEGSEFTFTIPCRHGRKNIGNIRELGANQRKKILLVETSEADASVIRSVLTKKYDVEESAVFDEIVNSFILEQPKLVLISIEVENALDLIGKIHAISNSTPIIVMTTSDFYHDQQRAIECGSTYVIPKPISATKLEEVVMSFIV